VAGVDLFYYIASLGIIVTTAVISFTCYRAVHTLNNLDDVLLGVKGIVDDIKMIKSGAKIGIFSLLSGIANRLRSKNYESKEVKK